MLFNKGDLVEVSKSIDWSLHTLQSILPHQLTDNVLDSTNPITRFAEIIDIKDKSINGQEKRIYTLRFSSDHTLQVESDFLLECCIPHGPSVHAAKMKEEDNDTI